MKVQFKYKEKDLKNVIKKSRLRNFIINTIIDIAIIVIGIVYIILASNDGNYQIYLGYLFSASGLLLYGYFLYKEYKYYKSCLSYNNEDDIISYEFEGNDVSGDIFSIDEISSVKAYNLLNIYDLKDYIILIYNNSELVYFPKNQISNLEAKNIVSIVNAKKSISKKNNWYF